MDNYIYLLLWVIGLLAYFTVCGCVYMIYEELIANRRPRPMVKMHKQRSVNRES